MIAVKFKTIESLPPCELLVYSSLNPIPFSLKIGGYIILPETIYSRNISGENFIEFRFNKDTRQLYEVTLVALQNNTVVLVDDILVRNDNNEYFACFLEEQSELDISVPMNIYRSEKAIQINWAENKDSLKYFPLNTNCILGVTTENILVSVTLTSLNKNVVFEIFGF